jgi:hypothetical protein
MAAAKTIARNFFMRLCSSFKLLPFGTRFFRVPILKPKVSGFNHNDRQILQMQRHTIFSAVLCGNVANRSLSNDAGVP